MPINSNDKDKKIRFGTILEDANNIDPYKTQSNTAYLDDYDRLAVKRNTYGADWNIEGYIIAIDNEFSKIDYYKNNYTVAERTLFLRTDKEKGFAKSDILYEKGIDKLSVAGFLSVCGYAVKVGEAINSDNTLYDEAGAAVSVFKGLELVLNNKGESSTIPKMLHLANDFLLRAVKPSLEKKEHKQAAVGLSLLVDLAIDFFGAK